MNIRSELNFFWNRGAHSRIDSYSCIGKHAMFSIRRDTYLSQELHMQKVNISLSLLFQISPQGYLPGVQKVELVYQPRGVLNVCAALSLLSLHRRVKL